MADNFNMKHFLTENKLGPYAKARVNENEVTKEDLGKDIEDTQAEKDMDFLAEKDKKQVSKEDKIQVIKEWIWFTCDEGLKKDDINKYNKMVDIYFADKNDVTKEDFQKIWNKVTEKYGIGDVGADSEAFPETWRDVQKGSLVNPNKQYEENITTDEDKKEINEYENPVYIRGEDGICYKVTDEGYKNKVADHFCGRRGSNEVREVEESINVKSVQKAEKSLQNLLRNIATNANISTDEKAGLINALGDLQDFIDEVGYDSEMEKDEYVSDYSRRRSSELDEVLSPKYMHRMDILVPETPLKALIGGAQSIIRDFKQEGFDDEDIFDYIVSKIKTLG